MPRYTLNDDGTLCGQDGALYALPAIDDQLIDVPHLQPHVITVNLPRGDVIGIKVIYLSHCWNERYDPALHPDVPLLIMDGTRPRVFNSARFEESRVLPGFLGDLTTHRLYWTKADRNYGVYNATTIVNGKAYTAFFTLAKERGRLNGSRHSLSMRVESAYHAEQPSGGMKVKAAAAVDAVLTGKKLKFR